MSASTRLRSRSAARWAGSVLLAGTALALWLLPAWSFAPPAMAFEAPAWAQTATAAPEAEAPTAPIELLPGPQLFVDDYLIQLSFNLTRRVNQPNRFRLDPVINSADFLNTQFAASVVRDPESGTFRLWYTAQNPDAPPPYFATLAYADSDDGIQFSLPFTYARPFDLRTPRILDDRLNQPLPGEEFKITHWLPRGGADGMRVAFSADGMNWVMYDDGAVVIRSVVEDDIWNPFYDPFHKQYGVLMKLFRPYFWQDASGDFHSQRIRLVGISTSSDFKHWTRPTVLFTPDQGDEGITEFYGGPASIQQRGGLLIGFLKVLRDDVAVAGAPNGAAGYGYTVLAWSRDGQVWQRDRHTDKFFEPDPRIGAWDYAHAWVDSAVEVDDEMYFYYGGYRWGHKYQSIEDRQIGVARMERDRYVAREAGDRRGWLRTPLVIFTSPEIRLNADAQGGEIRMQITDALGNPIPGFTFADCQPITTDSLDAPVKCSGHLPEIANLPVHLEFLLRHARIFAFGLE